MEERSHCKKDMVSTTIFSSLNISCSHNYPLFCQRNTLLLEELLPFLAGVLPAGAALLLDVRQVVVASHDLALGCVVFPLFTLPAEAGSAK